MLFAIWLSFVFSKKNPIVLLPPLYGTHLFATYNKTDIPWYCPKTMNDELLWVSSKFIVPPFYNCLVLLTQGTFDNETNQIKNLPGIDIKVHDFEGEESVSYIINGTFKFIDNYYSLLKYYKQRNYTVGENLFIAPYDWRMAPLFIDDFWPKFQAIIEKAFIQNNEKVTLLGFSMGTFMIHYFLTEKASKDWISKYVEKVVLLAPSWGGCHQTFDAIFGRFSPVVPIIKNDYVADMVTSLPGFFSHMPNEEIFKNDVVAIGPDGKNYTTPELTRLILNEKRIKDEYIPILEKSMIVQQKAPVDIGDVPVAIIYNSGVPTLSFVNYTKGFDKDPVRSFEHRGDGTLQVEGPRWACEHWDTKNKPIVCVDFANNDKKNYRHSALPANPFVHDVLFNFTSNDEWWKRKGLVDITLPKQVKIKKDKTFEQSNEINEILADIL